MLVEVCWKFVRKWSGDVGYLVGKFKVAKAKKNGLSWPKLQVKTPVLIFYFKNCFGWNLAQKVLLDFDLGMYNDSGSKIWS